MTAFATFLRIQDADRRDRFLFQDFFINETKAFGGRVHSFAPFRLNLGAATTEGDRSEEELFLPLNEISVSIAKEAVATSWLFFADSVIVDPITMGLVGIFTSGRWRARTWSQSTGGVVIILSPPFDAIQAEFPKRRLTRDVVGILPIPGSVPL